MQCDGFTDICHRTDAVRYRMKCKYDDDKKNFRNLCPVCQAESDAYWDEQWNELYQHIGRVELNMKSKE